MGQVRNDTGLITSPQWQKVTVLFSQVQVAALTKQVTIYTLPAKWVLHAAYGNVTTSGRCLRPIVHRCEWLLEPSGT